MEAWGKTSVFKTPSHHLAHHSFDVASVFSALMAMPVFADRANRAAGQPLTAGHVQWLASLAFLHDIGKLSPRFQAKAWDAPRINTRGHLSEGMTYFNVLLKETSGDLLSGAALPVINALYDCGDQCCADMAVRLLLAHHGSPIPTDDRRTPHISHLFPATGEYDWRSEDVVMGRAMRDWFPNAEAIPAAFLHPAFQHLFAGLLALADWIGSSENCFPHILAFDPEYNVGGRDRATRALETVGLTGAPWPHSPPTFRALTGHAAPRGAQAGMQDIPLDAQLVLLEAETGAGKTEAALMRFSALRSAGIVDSLYFALPTRSAASQIFNRVTEAMQRIGGPYPVLAVPGMLQAGDAKGKRLPGFKVLWDDQRQHWAAEHPTRFLGAAVAVGTIDQALMAGLQVSHAPLRASSLARSLLVIDEVHASDAYMNEIARTLVAGHTATGGHTLLMSATLASEDRKCWMGGESPGLSEAEAIPYPAIWHSQRPDAPAWHEAPSSQKTVTPKIVPTMDPARAADTAIDHASRGARVLVIRNTVATAIDTFHAVTKRAPELCLSIDGSPALHHARFAAEDRKALDMAVETALSPKAPRDGGRIIIGTQTLEQSLDIDADFILTDLCPMDVLLQRIGRLHRHSQPRPGGYETATAAVMTPEQGLGALAQGPSFFNGLGAWTESDSCTIAGVYIDLRALEATRRMIESEPCWTIPRDNRRLVESSLHSETLFHIEADMGWIKYSQNVDAKELAERQLGDLLTLDRGKNFPPAFKCHDEIVQTRLGARGPTFTLPDDTPGAFAPRISTIAPPAFWCPGLDGSEAVTVEPTPSGEMHIKIGEEAVFSYDNTGLKSP